MTIEMVGAIALRFQIGYGVYRFPLAASTLFAEKIGLAALSLSR